MRTDAKAMVGIRAVVYVLRICSMVPKGEGAGSESFGESLWWSHGWTLQELDERRNGVVGR